MSASFVGLVLIVSAPALKGPARGDPPPVDV